MAEKQRLSRTLDVKKDPLDLRDVLYEPTIAQLPFRLDNRLKSPKLLDQGDEGACTGFGLAAVANFLLHNRGGGGRSPFVSPRMLYEMAKRYDEWKGEHYDGSSIRGAMKGWNKHGVCPETGWPYDPKDAGRLTPKRQQAAQRYRLGAYFRVRHLHLNHMHSALHEAGVLYASADVHEGWRHPNRKTGRIPFSRTVIGGHAFAIVGYDEEGFWVQNSWGADWGKGGFGHLSYDDWLENGYDCWVAQLGVPTSNTTLDESVVGGRVSTFDYIPHETAVLNDIRLHFVNLGNDGQFSHSGLYASDEQTAEEIIEEGMKPRFRSWRGPRRLMLYAHGGLTDEKAAASGINQMRQHFLNNQIYPLHFIWETGFMESVKSIVEDAMRRGRFMGWRDDLKDKFQNLLDEAIELAARGLGLPIWSQMKDNARRASVDEPEGGAAYLAQRLARFAAEDGPLEIHLVGHSAGGIFHSYLIPRLLDAGLQVKTLTLYAPACTTELFKSNVVPRLRDGVERLTVFNLTDKYEQDDSVTPVYNKSILYLVSEAFERQRKAPILGMQRWLTDDATLKRKLGAPASGGDSTVVYSVGGPRVTLASGSTSHVGFDNDRSTLNSTLRIVRGSNTIKGGF
ncbi:MAG: C1 family peptidase [Dehalococcoidia bacterium]